MKREELREMGISEENIEKIMSDFGKEQQKSSRASNLQNELNTAKANAEELQKKLDEINEQNMSDIEKANKSVEEANKRIQTLESELAKNRQKQSLAEIGITGEQADGLFDENGTLNYKLLGEIISNREDAAKNAAIQDIAKNQGNPGGGSKNKEADISNAEKLVNEMFSANNNSNNSDILKNYI